jgi:hypothetical protein
MLMTLPQEFASCFEADGLQAVELLIQMLGSNSYSWFHDLGQPCPAVTRSVDRGATATAAAFSMMMLATTPKGDAYTFA